MLVTPVMDITRQAVKVVARITVVGTTTLLLRLQALRVAQHLPWAT